MKLHSRNQQKFVLFWFIFWLPRGEWAREKNLAKQINKEARRLCDNNNISWKWLNEFFFQFFVSLKINTNNKFSIRVWSTKQKVSTDGTRRDTLSFFIVFAFYCSIFLSTFHYFIVAIDTQLYFLHRHTLFACAWKRMKTNQTNSKTSPNA